MDNFREKMGKMAARALLTVLAMVIVTPLLWTWFALNYSYSDGERAGYIQKFSRKGWICKTWEGELALVNLPGAMPEIFSFTVRDEAVARRIQEVMGRRVAVTYEQHIGIPTSCFGETGYFITDVRSVE